MGSNFRAAMAAGAMGFSTSRAHTHLTPDDTPVASRLADWSEIEALVGVLAEMDAGIFQVGPNVADGPTHRDFLRQLRDLAITSGRPVMFGTISTRQGQNPNSYRYQLDYLDEAVAAGARMWGQTTTKSINAIFSLKSYLPFDALPHWKPIRGLPAAEQQKAMRDPDLRAKLVADEALMKPRDNVFQGGGAATTDPRQPNYANLFAMRDVKWDDPTVAQLAAARGRHPVEVMMDLMIENENQVFVQPLVNEQPDEVLDMLRHPWTLATFSDSGAHVCQEMGSSLQTHMLSYWVREKGAFTLEQAIRRLTFDNATAWELNDRGLVRTGFAADLVVFDADRIQPSMPTVESDLPGGARRLVQKAEGIAATVVNGVVAFRDGIATGEHGGKLLKGAGARD
jgi:N-acyl-D-amino-acid deacylase